MKTPDDLDRALGDWLRDGPTQPPEAPVEQAIQYARSHPRRRDPFAFLRRDPMAARSGTLLLRPALVLATVGLLIATAVGVVLVGGLPNPSPVVVPSPSVSPSPAVTPVPSFHVVLEDELDSGATVDIVDRSGTLVAARSAAVGEVEPDPGAPTTGDVSVKNVDPTTLWIGWGAGNCPDVHELVIEPDGRTMSITQPPFCGGDTIGVGRVLVLTLSAPIAAADVTATLVAVGE